MFLSENSIVISINKSGLPFILIDGHECLSLKGVDDRLLKTLKPRAVKGIIIAQIVTQDSDCVVCDLGIQDDNLPFGRQIAFDISAITSLPAFMLEPILSAQEGERAYAA